ncbi:MAG: bifunctional UDP-N-acetylglucosamine diphosphorylase/glucosamine-1-phosphate N-acetyltransferase GlmU [Proteobacteria bacterium]|nr:bifunctional UDP-N-acetylglucosamine diphosphorylase/glucosamine-1-phosphate N-acetyltransferase GlmU [Pseudomonadota bacterium]
MKICAIILSAGNSTRYISVKQKVFHELSGKKLIDFNVDLLNKHKDISASYIVTNKGLINEFLHLGYNNLSIQNPINGTGGAIKQFISNNKPNANYYLICLGDTPIFNKKILDNFIKKSTNQKIDINVLGQNLSNPTGYGRLIIEGKILKSIIEEKNCSLDQKNISLVNTGIFMLSKKAILLSNNIKKDRQKKEYLLTDLIKIGLEKDLKVSYSINSYEKIMGVNTLEEMQILQDQSQSIIKKSLMSKGVQFESPLTTFISHDAHIDRDVKIESNVVIRSNVIIKSGSTIKSFSYLEDCKVGKDCNIGPFARIRPGSSIEDNVKIGNFVEIKKSNLKKGVKVNHLSYIGDSSVGLNTNIGAGTITCNYDGKKKNKCIIGNNCFIGSNTSIVAPITIANKAYVGAGSVITKNIPSNTLAIARVKQKHLKL